MSDAEMTKRDEDAEINGEIERLTKLSPVQYDRERKDAARKLGFERLGTLDRVVEAARSKNSDTRGQGRPLEFPGIKPCPGAVNGSDLLDEIVACLCESSSSVVFPHRFSGEVIARRGVIMKQSKT